MTGDLRTRITASFEQQGLMAHLGARLSHVSEGEVLTVEYKINLMAPALGDHLEAVGTVLRSGRTLTVCQLEVYAVRGDDRTMVAAGQQTLIRIAG